MKTIHIGKIPVGDSFPTVLVAEAGTFFNRDIGKAEDYLRAAVEAGVPVFKTEILHNPDVCLAGTGLDCRFTHAGGVTLEDYRKLIERKTIPLADYAKLFAVARELKVPFVASVYDFEGIDFLVKEGGAAIKIARHNINHYPLIRYAARTGLPLIFDAGVIYLSEIAKALEVARVEGNEQCVINHHPGASPAPAEAHNLRIVATYKTMFDLPVGLSCHYRGEEILYVAVGCGVNLIEKGVVDDPDRNEQEVVSAVRLDELKRTIQRLNACSAALGSPTPQLPKEPRDLSVRKGCVAAKDIAANETLTLENVAFAWPPVGVKVEDWETILGKPASRAIKAGEPVKWEDVGF